MSQSWQGKSKGHTLGYRIFIAILRFAGTGPAYFLLRFVSFYYFLFSWSSTKHIYYFFHKRMGFGWLRSLISVYKNYYVFGQTLIDKTVVMSGMKVPFTYEFEDEHYQEDIIKGGKGGILIGAHAGNYELAGYYFNRISVRVNIVMVDREREQIKEYLESIMQEKNLNIITIRDDFSHIYEISNALRNNELVALHGDRFVEGSKTMKGMLLGEEAKFPMGPFVLAATFKVPVSFVFCFKETATHYHMNTTPPKIYDANKQVAIPQALADYTRELEKKIKRYPEQWFNYYNFWAK
jgi:predicted LPLAT superfamily acyltransferase